MLKNEVVQTMSLNIKFSYLVENSKFSRSNSYFSILTPTFLRDGFLNSCFQNPSENSVLHYIHSLSRLDLNTVEKLTQIIIHKNMFWVLTRNALERHL